MIADCSSCVKCVSDHGWPALVCPGRKLSSEGETGASVFGGQVVCLEGQAGASVFGGQVVGLANTAAL